MDDPLVRSYGTAFAGIVMISIVIDRRSPTAGSLDC
jgi:hypothetical protein